MTELSERDRLALEIVNTFPKKEFKIFGITLKGITEIRSLEELTPDFKEHYITIADFILQDRKRVVERIKPLDMYISNIDASRLGDVFIEVSKGTAGDNIDRGLILRRVLEEKGFHLIKIDATLTRAGITTEGE